MNDLLRRLVPCSWILSFPPRLLLSGVLPAPLPSSTLLSAFPWNLGQDNDLQPITLSARLAPGPPTRAAFSAAHHLMCRLLSVIAVTTEYRIPERSSFWQPVMSYQGRNQLFRTINHEQKTWNKTTEVVLFLNFRQGFFLSLANIPSRFWGIAIHSNIGSWYLVEIAFENSANVY